MCSRDLSSLKHICCCPAPQIVLFISVVEYNSNMNKWTQDTMFTDASREPGNLGFDPLHFGDKKVCVCVYVYVYLFIHTYVCIYV